MKHIQLSIIIVNWNSIELLKPCIISIMENNPDFDFEVIVVDNASEDNSTEILKKEFSQVKLIENKTNIGFTRANNLAINKSMGKYILLLNPDTLMIEKNILKNWIDYMEKHPDVGASGCKLINEDGSHQVGDAGFRPSLGTVFNFSFFLSKIMPLKCKGLFINSEKNLGPVEVDWICGADFLIRRSILDIVGLMNEDIFMYADDIEWGCRIRTKGFKVMYLTHFKIVHLQGGSAKKRRDINRFSSLWLRNIRLLFSYYNKNQPVWLYDIIISMGFLIRAFLYYCFYIKSKNEDIRMKAVKMFNYFKFSLSHMIG